MTKQNGHREKTNRIDVAGNARRTSSIVPNPPHGRRARDCRPVQRNIPGRNEMDDRAGANPVQRYPDTVTARLDVIYRVMNNETFGIRKAAKMVGGRMRLEQLIIEGRVRAEKGNRTAQNGKWLINAADVLKNAKI